MKVSECYSLNERNLGGFFSDILANLVTFSGYTYIRDHANRWAIEGAKVEGIDNYLYAGAGAVGGATAGMLGYVAHSPKAAKWAGLIGAAGGAAAVWHILSSSDSIETTRQSTLKFLITSGGMLTVLAMAASVTVLWLAKIGRQTLSNTANIHGMIKAMEQKGIVQQLRIEDTQAIFKLAGKTIVVETDDESYVVRGGGTEIRGHTAGLTNAQIAGKLSKDICGVAS